MPESDPEFLMYLSRAPHRIAAREIAAAERGWSESRARGDLLRTEDSAKTPDRRMARLALGLAFYDITEADVTPDDAEAIVDLFATTPELHNATLARIKMEGEWDAADPFEYDLVSRLSPLFDSGYSGIQVLPRKSPQANIVISIPAGLTSQNGFVALKRKRRFAVISPRDDSDEPPLEVTKISMFALDIDRLAQVSVEAFREVRLIIAMSLFNKCDFNSLVKHLTGADHEAFFTHQLTDADDRSYDFESALEDTTRLRTMMRQYGFSLDELLERQHTDMSTHLHEARGVDVVEQALNERSKLLTPSATTYYLHY